MDIVTIVQNGEHLSQYRRGKARSGCGLTRNADTHDGRGRDRARAAGDSNKALRSVDHGRNSTTKEKNHD
jgi:hypothetical protein